ncbi:hypothetical protein [Cellulomonas chitinilytica]|uniref:hypothetical protein n=1 Tax=Cellulomonas chitinilytica TaxID=398759 RepID=UPI001EF32405|nr:hypothetical protein [Cellulomonas chitinilytica]
MDADPTGASAVAAGYLRGEVLLPEAMIELALAQREGQLLEAVARLALPLPGCGVRFVPGIRSHEQAPSLVGLWEPLSDVLRSFDTTGQDVIVDAGRLGLVGSPDPVLDAADMAIVVVRSDMVALSGARSWIETLCTRFERGGAARALAVLLVGERAPFGARDIARALALPVVATVAWDPANAAVLSRGELPPRAGIWQRLAGRSGWEDSVLLGTLRAAGSAIRGTVLADIEMLQGAEGRSPA